MDIDKRRLTWLALAGVLLLCLAWRRLLLQGLVPVDGNMLALTFPDWRLMRSVWEDPRLPLWNPWRNLGEPHLADPQNLVLYPPMVLLSGLSDFAGFMRLWVVFHTLVAALALGALAKRLYGSLPAAATAAAAVGFNGFFIARVTFTNHFAAAAWLPAVLYFQETGSALGVGLCLSLMWLAGFPPFFLVGLAAAAVWAACQGRAGLRRFAAGCLWALGLCAVQIVPFLELMASSARRLVLSSEAATAFSIPAPQLLKELLLPFWSALSPEVSGDPAVTTFYAGLAALGLAVWGWRRGGRREKGLIVAVAVACLLSLGGNLPGYAAVAPLRVFRFPANWLLAASAGIALLAAAGVSKLKTERTRWLAAAAVALELVIFAQTPRAAWARPEFLSAAPALARSVPDGARLHHTPRLFDLWKRGVLSSEEDYLLMRDFLAPSFGAAFGVAEVSSYQTLQTKLHARFLERASAEPWLLDLAGAALVVDLAPGAPRVERVALRVLRNPAAKPRAYALDESARVSLLDQRPGRVRLAVDAPSPTTVVFAEADYPGWLAELDGKPVAHRRFEEVFLSAAVPEGRHELSFRFVSPAFWWGLLVSLVTAVLFLYNKVSFTPENPR